MAKRFTDSDKWKKKWFRELGSRLRDVRAFVLDDCDHAGIWEVDLDRVAYHTSQRITPEELSRAFQGELRFFDDFSKCFIPAFIEFQYGELSETCNAHKSVLKRLKEKGVLNSTPTVPQQLPNSTPTHPGTHLGWDQDKDKDKDQDKDLDKDEKGCGEKQPPAEQVAAQSEVPPESQTYAPRGLPPEIVSEWEATLKHYGREPNWQRDQPSMYRVFQRVRDWGRVKNAIAGYRAEKKRPDYDPSENVYVLRMLDKEKFDRLEGLGEAKNADAPGVSSSGYRGIAALLAESEGSRDAS